MNSNRNGSTEKVNYELKRSVNALAQPVKVKWFKCSVANVTQGQVKENY